MKKRLLHLLVLLLATALPGIAAERPNIILIMVDDMGFSDLGYMGGEIETPNLDSLAAGGVRFSQFYNSGRCCPTRATLMTGLHPHQTGIGWMTEPPGDERGKTEPPAYRGNLNDQCVTIAEALQPAGYATLMAGKWHLGYNDKSDWPVQRGFEKFYGCISGATRFFDPVHPRGMTLGNVDLEKIESTTDEAFYTTDAFTDYAITFLKEEKSGDNRPAFLYLAYTAPHWPLQAFEDDIAKYRGGYKKGWDHLRKTRFERQKALGLFPNETKLSPRTPEIPDWESFDEKKRDEMDLKMAVYAAMVDRVDQNIGRLVSYLKESGSYDNTLILFLSDNGACQEGGMLGRGEFIDIEKRNQQDNNSYGEAWANAGSTPFRYYKHFTHEGGTATPFFLHWPDRIPARKDWYTSPAQLIDILPTLLDVADATYPEQAPALDGISLRSAFSGSELDRGKPIFVEHETNAFVRDDKWKLVGKGVSAIAGTQKDLWELYDMETDRTETNNLAAKMPDKVNQLADQWETWAKKVQVYPRGPNSPRRGAKHGALKPEKNTPQIEGRTLSLSATVRHPKPNGVVIAQGGNAFGYSLYFYKGKPAFAWRNRSQLTTLKSNDTVKGEVEIRAEVSEKQIQLFANDKTVATAKITGFLAEQPGLGLFIGGDGVHAVGNYTAPNRFNGKLISHKIKTGLPAVTMQTPWGEKIDPANTWKEYPRPLLRRENWTNLNGKWDYAITLKDETDPPGKWAGKINVPFAVEAPLSGVAKRFTPDDALWYQRDIAIEKKESKRYLISFEAVDYQSTLWVNGKIIGTNVGGNLPFSFDVTEAIHTGENRITMKVTDATDSAYQLHGKQRLDPRGIWYTSVSGIWQTVWMEEIPTDHIVDIAPLPTNDGKVFLDVTCSGPMEEFPTKISVSFNGKKVFEHEGNTFLQQLSIPSPVLWSPESPNLYDLTIKYGTDTVHSYFAFRETAIEKDNDGHLRFTLNGEPIFHWGTLDQGWWPDGLLTPPSDEAMVSDILFLKDAGFNTIRKHIKVEPRRYYYHCDKIGMMVWQDQVSAKRTDDPKWTRLKPAPPTLTWPEKAHQQYMLELEKMIATLKGHPCIVQWVPFNERWGQHQTMEVGKWIVDHDPTRQINIASGGNFFPAGHIVDAHKYPDPEFPWQDGAGGRFGTYVKIIGEFGGHGFPVEGHLWSKTAKNWGYGGLPKDKAEWLDRYRTSISKLTELKKQGIAAGIYTQTTDVEGEINGLITYDRKVQKITTAELKKIAAPLFQ
ncbi:MAG: sulfatase-like hydrolase/transferase [Verrucomicrobiales bacterium]|nr:sulfatase-like hydrolase/transferase [Verrucomicrobiales bacterium]